METDYEIIVDGGCRGNPGEMYGSYQIRTRTGRVRTERRGFWEGTSNQAEYLTLLAALTDLLGRIVERGADPRNYTLLVKSDSQLVVNQLKGSWRVNDPQLASHRARALESLAFFKDAQIEWQPREESVKVLGH